MGVIFREAAYHKANIPFLNKSKSSVLDGIADEFENYTSKFIQVCHYAERKFG